MTISELANIYDDTIDFIEYWNKVVPESKVYRSFPCKCILHNEVSGASFSYSYTGKYWSCFSPKCNTRSAKVVTFHLRYVQKSNLNFNLYQCLKSLYKIFPEYHNNLPNPAILQDNTPTNNEVHDIDNFVLKNKFDIVTKDTSYEAFKRSISSNAVSHTNATTTTTNNVINTSDINTVILNLFIDRRKENED